MPSTDPLPLVTGSEALAYGALEAGVPYSVQSLITGNGWLMSISPVAVWKIDAVPVKFELVNTGVSNRHA